MFIPQARLAYGEPIMVDYTNPSPSNYIQGGQVVVQGGKVTICHVPMQPGASGAVSMGHAFYDVVAAVQSPAQFQAIYWDATNNVATTTPNANYLGVFLCVPAPVVPGDSPRFRVWVPEDIQEADTAVAGTDLSTQIADPGTGNAIPVTDSGQVVLTLAATGETRSLAAPTYAGQKLQIIAGTVATSATCTVTSATSLNVAAKTHMAFAAAGAAITLTAITVGANLQWSTTGGDAVTLS